MKKFLVSLIVIAGMMFMVACGGKEEYVCDKSDETPCGDKSVEFCVEKGSASDAYYQVGSKKFECSSKGGALDCSEAAVELVNYCFVD